MRIIEKAAALTAAPNKNNQHNGYYSTSDDQSSKKLKEQLGVLLLYLQTPLSRQQRTAYLKLFESRLRQYVDLEYCGVAL